MVVTTAVVLGGVAVVCWFRVLVLEALYGVLDDGGHVTSMVVAVVVSRVCALRVY